MTTRQLFGRLVIYGIVLGGIDALTGRVFGTSPDPNYLLVLLAAAWVGFTLGANSYGARVAAFGALTFFSGCIVTFAVLAHLLAGWNNSVPWRTSPGKIAGFVLAASFVGALFGRLGARARAASNAKRDTALG